MEVQLSACVHAYACMFQTPIACGCPQNVWVCYNFISVVPGCLLFRDNFVLKSPVGSSNLVRCPESRSVRLSEVAYALVL